MTSLESKRLQKVVDRGSSQTKIWICYSNVAKSCYKKQLQRERETYWKCLNPISVIASGTKDKRRYDTVGMQKYIRLDLSTPNPLDRLPRSLTKSHISSKKRDNQNGSLSKRLPYKKLNTSEIGKMKKLIREHIFELSECWPSPEKRMAQLFLTTIIINN